MIDSKAGAQAMADVARAMLERCATIEQADLDAAMIETLGTTATEEVLEGAKRFHTAFHAWWN